MSYTSFIPPKCNIVNITKRIWKLSLKVKIIRNDWKEYNILATSYRYNNNLLNINIGIGKLPILIEIEEKFLIIK